MEYANILLMFCDLILQSLGKYITTKYENSDKIFVSIAQRDLATTV